MKKIVLLSGLPRSGSTLLRAYLEQNEALNITPYSGLSQLLNQTINTWNSTPHTAYPRPEALNRIMHAIVENYHDEGIAVDLSRDWTSNIEIFEKAANQPAHIVCMVRNFAEVIASCERLSREKPYDRWGFAQPANTLEERIRNLEQSFIGFSHSSLVNALDAGYGHKLKFVDYHKFIADPYTQMQRIHEHWELASFEYNFDQIKLKTKENDQEFGMTELHKLKPVLCPPSYKPEDYIGKFNVHRLNEQYPEFWKEWT